MRSSRNKVAIGLTAGVSLGLALLAAVTLFTRPSSPAPLTVQGTPTLIVLAPTSSPFSTLAPSDSPSRVPQTTPTPAIVTYIVRENDTLFDIALEYETTVDAIKAANGLTSDIILPGDVLTIPVSSTIALITPIPTAYTEGETLIHVVASGETLSDIAERYGTTVEAIQSANSLESDAVQVGQSLVIPQVGTVTHEPTSEVTSPLWRPSPLEGDLDTAYPLKLETSRFTFHYQPDSLPAQDRDIIIEMVESGLSHIESILQVSLEGRFDLYAAGSLFAPPDMDLRGRSFSAMRRVFFLYDGSGSPEDRQYIVTHELTHVTTWNTMGRPISVMLHEGVAVFTGMTLVEDKGYVPLDLFCAAYHKIGQLPLLSSSPDFLGHIQDLDIYYAAGCFVQFLIEKYGTGSFATVYHTGDYVGVYGKSLADLEAEWIASIEAANYSFPFDPAELAHRVTEVAEAYNRLFSDFTGEPVQMAAYRELDRARITLLQGQLGDTASRLATFDELMKDK